MSLSVVIATSSEGSPMGIDKIPIDVRCGEERAMLIGRNRKKE